MNTKLQNITVITGCHRVPVVINVGGTRFETYMDTLAKRRNTRLSALNKDSRNYRTNCNEYFFDRDPIIFRSVIDFYRTGTLHLPSDICSTIIRRELEYWNIHEEHVAPCCWGFFRAHKDQETTVKLFSKAMGRDVDQHQRKRSQWKLALWTFLEDPSSSRNALVRRRS